VVEKKTKGPRTVELIRGKEPFLRQIVCEVRYLDGQSYLDHCGRILKGLLREAPEWVVAPEPTAKGTTVYNILTGTQLGISMQAASLSLDKSSTDELIDPNEVEKFLHLVDEILGKVLDELEVTEFARIGYREYHHFSFSSKEESEKWLQSLGLVAVSPALYQAFQATPDALGVAVIMQGENCRYRIGLNGIERSAQIPVGDQALNVRASAVPQKQKQVLLEALKMKRQRQISSAFAVVVDVDAFLVDPDEPDLSAFIQEQAKTILPLFRQAVSTQPPQKGK
jgi:hypothetical protein